MWLQDKILRLLSVALRQFRCESCQRLSYAGEHPRARPKMFKVLFQEHAASSRRIAHCSQLLLYLQLPPARRTAAQADRQWADIGSTGETRELQSVKQCLARVVREQIAS